MRVSLILWDFSIQIYYFSMKVSIVTAVYNAQEYIEDCIRSVISQEDVEVEYIVIDGNSTDNTVDIIKKYASQIDVLRSEPDQGMYDALNKGIALATGDIIGILNSDDLFANTDILVHVVQYIQSRQADAVFGNLNYVKRDDIAQITRKWISNPFNSRDFETGWMPAHPTLFIKKSCFEQFGGYSLDYGTASDYELMLRFLYKHQIKAVFIDKLLVNMRTGGLSNGSFRKLYFAFINDYKAIVNTGFRFPLFILFCKKIRKLTQYS